ncbi:hypothetical protein RHMOL_Rhmol02G0306100 [Rhododendron molle]|uniref:Uncharacterized protein n=1 Tax=Rhododendron molle TaxID=49168 RepID=A0ACC0PWG6_RHOML|nr:hypothetical protein RHMOL_Rhmol02G0306100 [Rhododendron molle]
MVKIANQYKDEDKALMSAFHELTLVLESVSKIHKLPLALAWVPCSACDSLLLARFSSVGGEYLGAFEANNNHLIDFDFLIANTGYHLPKGSVAERVLSVPNMLFCEDVTQFSIAEYPLVPFVRHCKLSGWFTICLHSIYTGEDVSILEFFLPASSKDNENTLTTVDMILRTIKENFKTFKFASGKELGEVSSIEVFDIQNGWKIHPVQMVQAGRIIPSPQLLKDAREILPLGQLYQSSFDSFYDGMDITSAEQDNTVATISRDSTTKTQERKRKKTGVRVDISLDDLLRFSALSRSEAARGLKVSDSTLKRICRRHGIHRWPPRNINKEAAFPIALPNVGAIVLIDSQEEPSLRELDAAIDGAHDLREDDSLPSISHLENKVIASTFKHIGGQHGITPWPNQQNGGGGTTHPDSLDQPSMDPLIAERNDLEVTCSEEGTIKMQKREQGKTGVRIEISLDDILLYSDKKLEDAARDLKVSIQIAVENIEESHVNFPFAVSGSTLKRICRGYGIHRWPPRNISEPSHVKNEGQTLQLNSDLPLNQASASVAHIKPESQEANKVLVKAKYGDMMLKFGLSLSAGFRELGHEVAKRLNLDVGTYFVKYKDEDDDLILIACDDDLRACVHSSISLGNTSTLVLLELKHPI